MDQAILEKEALKLPGFERAMLADALLASLDNEAASKFEKLWADEAEDRLQAFREGKLTALDGPTVINALRQKLPK